MEVYKAPFRAAPLGGSPRALYKAPFRYCFPVRLPLCECVENCLMNVPSVRASLNTKLLTSRFISVLGKYERNAQPLAFNNDIIFIYKLKTRSY